MLETVKATWSEHKRVVFDGDGYSEEWHAEAEQRGLPNLSTTPDALPALIDPRRRGDLREVQRAHPRASSSRATRSWPSSTRPSVNIEGETCRAIARTMLLPAATRHLAELRAAGVEDLIGETEELIKEFVFAIRKLEAANEAPPGAGPSSRPPSTSRDAVLPAMDAVREVADKLESIVADDLWPLPKYSEILFVK